MLRLDALVEPFWAPGAFFAKEESVTILKPGLPMGTVGVGGKKPDSFWPKRGGRKGVPVPVLVDVQSFPVIHTSPSKLLVGDFKAQGVNQVESGASEST